MKTKLLIAAAVAVAFSVTGSAFANDVALSPKARDLQNSLIKVSGTTPAALDQSLNSPKSGSPKGLALAESLHKAPGTNSATVASAGYQATDVHGTAASPKLRQQLDEFDAQFTTVAPLK